MRMTLKKTVFLPLTALFLLSAAVLQGAEDPFGPGTDCPFGICAHLCGDSLAPSKLPLIRSLGLRWVRADLGWGTCDRGNGEWNFDEFDRLVEQCEENGVNLLPVLSQDSDRLPTLDAKNFEAWKEYVRRTVTRYKDRIRYWEIINEPNFYLLRHPELPGEDFSKIMQGAYEVIKSIDPDLMVVHGGYAGTPLGYLEAEYSSVTGPFYDVMNIHCYQGGMKTMESVQLYEKDLKEVAELMARHGDGEKKIWLTETGWSSLPNYGESYNSIFLMVLSAAFPEKMPVCGYLWDENYGPGLFYESGSLARMFPPGSETKCVTLNELKTINPAEVPVLLLPPSEAFPSAWFDDLVRYVEQGGLLILAGGAPLRYEVEADADGIWQAKTTEAPEKYRRRFALDYQTHETNPEVPNLMTIQIPKEVQPMVSPQLAAILDGFHNTLRTRRVLTDRYFSEANSVQILLNAACEDFCAPVAALIQPAGCKGFVLVTATVEQEMTNITDEEHQAVYLPHDLLIARSNGMDKIFWYELQSPEQDALDKEDFFGITHRNLSAKPAFFAYKTLLAEMPEGSTVPELTSANEAVLVSWQKPTGEKCWAVWSPAGERTASVRLTGTIQSAVDYLGRPVSIDPEAEQLDLSPAVLYLTGPEKVEILP